jgi:hypothetical protein
MKDFEKTQSTRPAKLNIPLYSITSMIKEQKKKRETSALL